MEKGFYILIILTKLDIIERFVCNDFVITSFKHNDCK